MDLKYKVGRKEFPLHDERTDRKTGRKAAGQYEAGNRDLHSSCSTLNCHQCHIAPGVKGDTATNATKPATLESGVEIRVPLFINEGDLIQVDTRDGSYLSRVKE